MEDYFLVCKMEYDELFYQLNMLLDLHIIPSDEDFDNLRKKIVEVRKTLLLMEGDKID